MHWEHGHEITWLIYFCPSSHENVCEGLTQMGLWSAFHYIHVAFVKYMGKSTGPESCGVAITILFKIQCKHLAVVGWYQ